MTLSILHAPINIAGAPGQLSAGLREAGATSDLLVWREHPFTYGADVVLDLPTGGYAQLPRRVALQAAALARHARRYDVVHVHGEDSFLPRHADLPLLRRLGKGVAVSFWGSDIRDRPARELRWLRHVQLACVGSYLTYGRAPRGAWRDYVVLPTSTTHRWLPDETEPLRALVIEARGHVGPPRRYLAAKGQFVEHAPYCERDLRGPTAPYRSGDAGGAG